MKPTLIIAERKNNLAENSLLKLSDIPCICHVTHDIFRVFIQPPLPEMVGMIENLSIRDIEARAPAMGGGALLYQCYGFISVSQTLDLQSLSLFIESVGWCPVIKSGCLAEPLDIDDDQEIDEMLKKIS